MGVPPPRGEWPLFGREQLLHEALTVLRRRDGGGLALVGEEGVGKTRLVAEVVRRLEQQGVRVLRTVATSASAALPFAAVADLLPPDLDAAASPFELMRLAVRGLRASEPRAGIVLAVDDAHLLDEGSAALLAHTVRARAARALLVLGASARIPDSLSALLDDGSLERAHVAPLAADQLAQLCAAVLGGPVEGATLRRLVQLAGGNVLHLHELLDAGLAEGTLLADGGVWRSSGRIASGTRLEQLVTARLIRQSDRVREVVEVVALAGTVEVDLLERVVGGDAVAEAERSRLVAVFEDGLRLLVGISHPLYAEALRTTAPRLTARRWHQRLAAALAATECRRQGDVLRLALHRLDGGQTPDELLLLQAAEVAASRFDVALAVRLSCAAARNGSSRARLAAASALYRAGRNDDAERLLRELYDDARLLAEPGAELRGQVALLLAACLLSGAGRAAAAEELLRSAGAALAEGPLRDELAALSGMVALSLGRVTDALDRVEPLLARPEATERVTLRALLVAVSGWAQVGRADQATAAGQKLAQDSTARVLPAEYEAVLVGLCYAHGVAGRLDEAEQLARSRYEAALDHRAADLRTLWSLALGQAALARGQVAEAEPRLREAVLLLRHDQSMFGVHALAWALGCLAEAAGLRGDAAAARAALDEACAVTPEPCFIHARELAGIWVTAAESTSAAAAQVALDVADEAAGRGLGVVEAVALHQAARLARPGDVAPRLADLAERVDGELVRAHAAHAAALCAGDVALLQRAADTYERLGVWLDAAEASAQAAVAAAAQGLAATATRSAQRSRALAARCPGARSHALSPAVATTPLTPREREIAQLAARGWTTARIAESLVLSGRTVDNHLHRAYSKLGIASRNELAKLLGT